MSNLLNLKSLNTLYSGANQDGEISATVAEYLNELVVGQSIAISSALQASSDVAGWIKNGTGNIRVFTPMTLMSKQYKFDNTNANDKLGIYETIINKTAERTIRAELPDSFDINLFNTLPSYQAKVLDSISKSIALDCDSYYLTSLYKAAMSKNAQSIALTGFCDASLSNDDHISNTKSYINFVNNLTKMFNRTTLGVDKNKLLTLTDINGIQSRFFGLVANQVQNIPQVVEGAPETFKILGQTFVQSPLMKNIIPAGTAFSQDTDIDMLNANAIISYPGAVVCVPYIESMTVGKTADWTHDVVIVKYRVAYGELRPDLNWLITETAIGTNNANAIGISTSKNGNVISGAVGSTLQSTLVSLPFGTTLPTGTYAVSSSVSGITGAVASGVLTLTIGAAAIPANTTFNITITNGSYSCVQAYTTK